MSPEAKELKVSKKRLVFQEDVKDGSVAVQTSVGGHEIKVSELLNEKTDFGLGDSERDGQRILADLRDGRKGATAAGLLIDHDWRQLVTIFAYRSPLETPSDDPSGGLSLCHGGAENLFGQGGERATEVIRNT